MSRFNYVFYVIFFKNNEKKFKKSLTLNTGCVILLIESE